MHKKGIQIVKVIGSNITAWFGLLSPHLEWSVKQSCVGTCYFNLNIVRLSVKTTFWQGWLLCKNRIVSLSLSFCTFTQIMSIFYRRHIVTNGVSAVSSHTAFCLMKEVFIVAIRGHFSQVDCNNVFCWYYFFKSNKLNKRWVLNLLAISIRFEI